MHLTLQLIALIREINVSYIRRELMLQQHPKIFNELPEYIEEFIH